MDRSTSRGLAIRRVLVACALALVPTACGNATAPEADADLGERGITSLTEAGHYRVAMRPESEQVASGALHTWIVHVEQADGQLFAPTRLAVDGGMPQHGHGFQTLPRVTRSLGGGDFLVEGIKFHMPGDWIFRVEVVGPLGEDVARLDVLVDP
jgi:hypothetical protein